MTRRLIVARSLTYYWRSNLAVVAGVATAVAVLSGALVVGDSVRGTLRDLAVSRLGATDVAVVSTGFVREDLADDLRRDRAFEATFTGAAPLVALEGLVTVQTSGRRVGRVRVYGVDERFWSFHRRPRKDAIETRAALISPALAEETGATVGDPLLVRVALRSDIPLESLHGRKDDPGRTIRATIQAVIPAEELGEFSLSPEQGRIRAVFLPLERVQRELELERLVNTVLVSTRAGPEGGAQALLPLLGRVATVADAGLSVGALDTSRTVVVGSGAGVIAPGKVAAVTRAAESIGLGAESVLTYLANTIRAGGREIPYSLVTARDLVRVVPMPGPIDKAPIVLNDWAARELGARVGDVVGLDYFVWEDPGRLVTRSAEFTLSAVVPIATSDRDLAPDYPGITDSPTLDAWNPPFPFDLSRIRPADEAYWDRFRATPKAFIRIEDGQRLWGSRYGNVTSLRVDVTEPSGVAAQASRLTAAIRANLDPEATGLIVHDVRADALSSAEGVTDFGQYFIYFSFFIVVSALVLAAMFFALGVEERARQVGLFSALGVSNAFVRSMFMGEALVLSVVGSAIGVAGALGYASGVVHLLRTRWIGAVGTSALSVHVTSTALVAGAVGGLVAALVCTWLTLRGLRHQSSRALMAGVVRDNEEGSVKASSRWLWATVVAAVSAAGLMAAGVAGAVAQAGAFFGAASLVLVSGLAAVMHWCSRPGSTLISGRGVWALARLGLRNAAARPVRSALVVTVIASATFILVAVDAFRKDAVADSGPESGLGGYALIVESLLPIAHDLRTPEGRASLGLVGIDDVRIEPFRLRPGDDASCLNLYQPTNPRILGVTEAFRRQGRFAFRATLAETDAERANPWLLLERVFGDGAIPVIADANSLAYVLHEAVGDDIVIERGDAPVRLRVVASLADSVFQRELLMAEASFVGAFPEHEGYRFALAEAPPARALEAATAIEDRLSAFAVDVTPTEERLAEFHRVENTFIATFQTLGGLGLLVGTVGLGAVLLRSVLERRRELALLGAVGYRPEHIRVMLLSESLSLLLGGLGIGAIAAAVATLPAVIERGGRVPVSVAAALLVALVFVAGMVATVLAARAATRQPLVEALRSE